MKNNLKENTIVPCNKNIPTIQDCEKAFVIANSAKELAHSNQYTELDKQILNSELSIDDKTEKLDTSDEKRSKKFRRCVGDLAVAFPVAVGYAVLYKYIKGENIMPKIK